MYYFDMEKEIYGAAVDWVQVGREAHQLGRDYGKDAWIYATRFAERAQVGGEVEERAFWLAVAAALQPRSGA
jgi:hypothetical protein